MRRAPIVLSATVAGLGATLAFHAHAPAATPATTAQTSSGSGSTPSGSTPSSATSSSKTQSSSTKIVTGDPATNQYGNVQLKVTISSGKITKIEPVQLPSGDPKSSEISSYAEPMLRRSALSKQSAKIDAVSGATYTSDSYTTALQSALDKASFQASTSGSDTSAG